MKTISVRHSEPGMSSLFVDYERYCSGPISLRVELDLNDFSKDWCAHDYKGRLVSFNNEEISCRYGDIRSNWSAGFAGTEVYFEEAFRPYGQATANMNVREVTLDIEGKEKKAWAYDFILNLENKKLYNVWGIRYPENAWRAGFVQENIVSIPCSVTVPQKRKRDEVFTVRPYSTN